jgi:hypothetical protein
MTSVMLALCGCSVGASQVSAAPKAASCGSAPTALNSSTPNVPAVLCWMVVSTTDHDCTGNLCCNGRCSR